MKCIIAAEHHHTNTHHVLSKYIMVYISNECTALIGTLLCRDCIELDHGDDRVECCCHVKVFQSKPHDVIENLFLLKPLHFEMLQQMKTAASCAFTKTHHKNNKTQ